MSEMASAKPLEESENGLTRGGCMDGMIERIVKKASAFNKGIIDIKDFCHFIKDMILSSRESPQILNEIADYLEEKFQQTGEEEFLTTRKRIIEILEKRGNLSGFKTYLKAFSREL